MTFAPMATPEMPLVSIVTPVLNGERFLPETLASVRGQDYPRLEHVVVDGGSTDGTLDLLRHAPGVVWASARDAGMYDAVGRGFDLAALRRHNFVPPHAAFVRRRVVEEGHRPDPSLRFAGDWDWFLGMARAGKGFAHLSEVLAEFRLHSLTKTRTVSWRAKVGEWRRVCARHDASLAVLLWYEGLWGPLRRRLRLPV